MEEVIGDLKEKVKERYGKIALTGNSDCCCIPCECSDQGSSPMQAATVIGYDTKELAKGGILERQRYNEIPPRVEYRLTNKGQELAESVIYLLQWMQKWSMQKQLK